MAQGDEMREAPRAQTGRLQVPRLVPWDVAEAGGVLLVFILSLVVADLLRQQANGGSSAEFLSFCIADAATLTVTFLMVQFWTRGQVPLGESLGLRWPDARGLLRGWKAVLAGGMAYGATIIAVAATMRAFQIRWEGVQQPLMREIAQLDSPGPILMAVLAAAVAAPVTEEIIFRGMFYLPLRQQLGVVPAALIVSALFAVVHSSPWVAVQLTVLSLTFISLFELTGSLWVPIIAHGLFNGTNILLIRLAAPPG